MTLLPQTSRLTTHCNLERSGRGLGHLPVLRTVGLGLALLAFGLGPAVVEAQASSGREPAPQETIVGGEAVPDLAEEVIELSELPLPDLSGLEPTVAEQLSKLQDNLRAVLEDPKIEAHQLAENYGELAKHYHAYELLASAEIAYLNAIALVEKDVRWPHLLGHLYKTNGELAAAKPHLERALEIRPDDTPAMIYLGEIALAESRPEDARAYFEQVLERAPVNLVARALLAELDLAEGRYAEAVDIFEEVLAEQPHANRFHYSLAMAYRGLGRVEEARQQLELRGEVGLAPKDQLVDGLHGLKIGERVYLLRGRQAFRAGRYAEAASAFAKAVEAQPESSRARVNLGSALAAGGKVEEAMVELRRAIEIEPGNGTAHHNLARLLLAGGDAQGAYDHYKSALVANPRDLQSLLDLGSLLRRAGQPEAALGHLAKALEIEPASEEVQLQHASVLVDLGRFAEARTALEAGLGLLPQAGRLAFALAKLLAASPDVSVRDGARAIELAQQVWKAAPSVSHAETLAQAFAQADQCTDAAAWARVALTQLNAEAPAEKRASLEASLARYEGATSCRPPA